MQDLKRGKSAGPDDLIPEFFINSIDIIIPLLNKFFNRIFDHADYPEPWSYSIIVSILKKGNANDPINYRGISLLDVLGKIYTLILTRRVTFYTNIFSKISESQAGFRDGYSTTDQAFILYSLIHKYLSKKRGKLYVAFVDLTKAFDSINRSKLWKVVSKTGIKGKLYKNLLKPVSHQPCGSRAPVYEHTFGVFLAAASRPSYVSQGRKAVATSYGEFSTCSFSLRFSADVWRSQGSCKAASR